MAPTPTRVLVALTKTPARLLVATLSVLLLITGVVVVTAVFPSDVPVAQPASNGALVFDESTATLTARDEFSDTYTDAQGVSRVALSLDPVNVLRDGEWVPASAKLEVTGDGWKAHNHSLALGVANRADADALVTAERDGHVVTTRLLDAAPVDGSLEESSDESSRVVFDDAVDGAALEYEVTPSRVKENVVLDAVPSEAPVYTWAVSTGDLVAERNDMGEVVFVDAAGEVVMTMPTLTMWDSSGVEEMREPAIVNVDFELERVAAGEYLLRLLPDPEWLADPERVYPVYVDPSLASGVTSSVAYKSDGVTASGYVRVGNPQQSTTTQWRSVVTYNYSASYNKRVTRAYLKGTKTAGTANCYAGFLTHASAWAYTGTGTYMADLVACTVADAEGELITAKFSDFANRSHQSAEMLIGYECGNCYSYKQLSTTLYVEYVDLQTIGTVTGPMNGETGVGSVVVSATGTLSSGATQLFRYVFTSDNGGAAYTSPYVAAGNYTLPPTALTPGKHYTWKVESIDSLPMSPTVTKTSSTYHFTTNNAPDVPSNVKLNGQLLSGHIVVTTDRPELSAVVSDADGGWVQALFTISQDGIVIMDSVPGTKVNLSGTGPYVSTIAPEDWPYPLSPGLTYTVQVVAFDGYAASAGFTPTGTFTGPPREPIREIPGDDDDKTGAQ